MDAENAAEQTRAAHVADLRAKALEGVTLDGPPAPTPGQPQDPELAKLHAQPAAETPPEPTPEQPATEAAPPPTEEAKPPPVPDLSSLVAAQVAVERQQDELAQRMAALKAEEDRIAAARAEVERFQRIKQGDKLAALQELGLTPEDVAKLAASQPAVSPAVAAQLGVVSQLQQQVQYLAAQTAAVPHMTLASNLLASDEFELCRLDGVTPEQVGNAVVRAQAAGHRVTAKDILADHEKRLEEKGKATLGAKKFKALAPAATPAKPAPAPALTRAGTGTAQAQPKKAQTRKDVEADILANLKDF